MKKLFAAFALVLIGIQPAAQSDPKTAAFGWVDANAPTLNRVNRNIWTWAETGLEETKSSEELQSLLRANGFTVEANVAGMPTAFVATYGTGKPVIGILAEFAALPGLSQDSSPERSNRAGATAGHGCGHSVFGTASSGGAIAIKQALASGAIKGTVKLFGTPAEETGLGKTYMLREGVFKDVEEYFVWLTEIARAAAAMSRTRLIETRVDADLHEVLPNRTLVEVIQKNLELVGPPVFDEREKAFARATQKDLKPAPTQALADRVEPLSSGAPTQGVHSTDVGDLTWFFPVGQFTVATYAYGAPGHSWQIVACTGMSIGEKGMLVAAKTIAGSAIDLYRSPELIQRAREDLKKTMASQKYTTLIPEGQKAPKTIR